MKAGDLIAIGKEPQWGFSDSKLGVILEVSKITGLDIQCDSDIISVFKILVQGGVVVKVATNFGVRLELLSSIDKKHVNILQIAYNKYKRVKCGRISQLK